ncbi:glycoside hydrolase family 65 protein [Pseudorhodoferax sp. Leaf267]|uniref:glycoside hydrolase family 65 protein n=1 Tax=Pseudorhodoferax sp. Leaf267 TaxID=1736316 RepID=UPI0009EA8417|nr:glycosyl hydrolase family 65 protein [Pseudorhodoferax sp. Leaf267]
MTDTETSPLGVAPWSLPESRFDPARAPLHETLFCLGNGRIGLRGAHEEAHWPGTEQDATYLNGFHDVEDIAYAENAYGLARHHQFLVAVPNAKAIGWQIDDERFDPRTGAIEDYQRALDFRTGLLTRNFTWVSPQGRRVAVRSTRLVSLERESICALRYELQVLDGPARIVVESFIDARAHEMEVSDDPRVGSANAAKSLVEVSAERRAQQVQLIHRTKRSELYVASFMHNSAEGSQGAIAAHDAGTTACLGHRFEAELMQGESLRLDKVFGLMSSQHAPAADVPALLGRAVEQAVEAGFAQLCAEQQAYLARFWQDADIEIEGDDALQQGMRFNQLHLLQSVGRDGRTNIAAKGVTGSGYDGHYFWDTEIYVFPMLLHTQPQIARRLLEFRYHTLDAARARAREMAHAQGALFPWRTINGPECSSYFPAGTAQYHINADIAFAVKRYWEATGDDAFMLAHGVELVFETARIWMGLGHFQDGRFEDGSTRRYCIHTVTGPDEYTALVDNNFYTNAMAQMHLAFAVELVQWMAQQHAGTLLQLQLRIGLDLREAETWQEAARRMYLPYDGALGVHPQDDGFLAKPRWGFDTGSDDATAQRPLLLHYHPLVIYRHQICKQADVLLALLLLGEQFSLADKRRDFDYYEPITTHDSSLSRCIFGIVASEVGYHAKAYDYFAAGARADLDDHHHNTRHGVHTAAMAGAWLGVVAGFAGLRMHKRMPTFAPTLPAHWQRYGFKLRLAGVQLQLSVDAESCTYRLLEGGWLALRHCGQTVVLGGERTEMRLPLATRPPVLAVPAVAHPA